jgi:hypothetical protein
MNLALIATFTAGHPFRESIKHALDGDTAVVQMKDVDAEKGLNCTELYRVNLTGRKQPDYLQRADILFMGWGYRIFAVLVDQDLERTLLALIFSACRRYGITTRQPHGARELTRYRAAFGCTRKHRKSPPLQT